MISARLILSLAFSFGSVVLIGCRGEAAPSKRLAGTQSTANSPLAVPASLTKDGDPIPLVGKHARPSHGDPHREAFLSTYKNPESGISFRYPRNYALEEGDVQEHSFFLKTQQDLDLERPGATLVATVFIPEDGYPNTTFEHGSLQLIVDESSSAKACRDTLPARSATNLSGSIALQGTPFLWTHEVKVTAGVNLAERTYAGYSQDTCYEFLLSVAADQEPDADGFRKPADLSRIMKQLVKIVSSTQFFSKSATPPAATSEENTDRL